MEKAYQELCAARSKVSNIQKLLNPAITAWATATFESSTRHKTAESLKAKRLDILTSYDFEAHIVTPYEKYTYTLKWCLPVEAQGSIKVLMIIMKRCFVD